MLQRNILKKQKLFFCKVFKFDILYKSQQNLSQNVDHSSQYYDYYADTEFKGQRNHRMLTEILHYTRSLDFVLPLKQTQIGQIIKDFDKDEKIEYIRTLVKLDSEYFQLIKAYSENIDNIAQKNLSEIKNRILNIQQSDIFENPYIHGLQLARQLFAQKQNEVNREIGQYSTHQLLNKLLLSIKTKDIQDENLQKLCIKNVKNILFNLRNLDQNQKDFNRLSIITILTLVYINFYDISQKNPNFQIILKEVNILIHESDEKNLYVNQLTQINREDYRNFILEFVLYRYMCKEHSVPYNEKVIYNHIDVLVKKCKNKQMSNNNFQLFLQTFQNKKIQEKKISQQQALLFTQKNQFLYNLEQYSLIELCVIFDLLYFTQDKSILTFGYCLDFVKNKQNSLKNLFIKQNLIFLYGNISFGIDTKQIEKELQEKLLQEVEKINQEELVRMFGHFSLIIENIKHNLVFCCIQKITENQLITNNNLEEIDFIIQNLKNQMSSEILQESDYFQIFCLEKIQKRISNIQNLLDFKQVLDYISNNATILKDEHKITLYYNLQNQIYTSFKCMEDNRIINFHIIQSYLIFYNCIQQLQQFVHLNQKVQSLIQRFVQMLIKQKSSILQLSQKFDLIYNSRFVFPKKQKQFTILQNQILCTLIPQITSKKAMELFNEHKKLIISNYDKVYLIIKSFNIKLKDWHKDSFQQFMDFQINQMSLERLIVLMKFISNYKHKDMEMLNKCIEQVAKKLINMDNSEIQQQNTQQILIKIRSNLENLCNLDLIKEIKQECWFCIFKIADIIYQNNLDNRLLLIDRILSLNQTYSHVLDKKCLQKYCSKQIDFINKYDGILRDSPSICNKSIILLKLCNMNQLFSENLFKILYNDSFTFKNNQSFIQDFTLWDVPFENESLIQLQHQLLSRNFLKIFPFKQRFRFLLKIHIRIYNSQNKQKNQILNKVQHRITKLMQNRKNQWLQLSEQQIKNYQQLFQNIENLQDSQIQHSIHNEQSGIDTSFKINKNLIMEFLLDMYFIKNFQNLIKIDDDLLKQISLNYTSLLEKIMPLITHFKSMSTQNFDLQTKKRYINIANYLILS